MLAIPLGLVQQLVPEIGMETLCCPFPFLPDLEGRGRGNTEFPFLFLELTVGPSLEEWLTPTVPKNNLSTFSTSRGSSLFKKWHNHNLEKATQTPAVATTQCSISRIHSPSSGLLCGSALSSQLCSWQHVQPVV